MGLKEWIIPQDKVFYDLLERNADLAVKAVASFNHLLANWQDLTMEREVVHRLEHEADTVSHQIFERLNQVFITPIDREDIARLAHSIDDVIDAVDGAANCMTLYELKKATLPMHAFGEILQKQVEALREAVGALRKAGSMAKVIAPLHVEIHRLENEADRIRDTAVAELYRHTDPVHIIKHKEVYDLLEAATDRCEDAADVLQDVLRKNS